MRYCDSHLRLNSIDEPLDQIGIRRAIVERLVAKGECAEGARVRRARASSSALTA